MWLKQQWTGTGQESSVSVVWEQNETTAETQHRKHRSLYLQHLWHIQYLHLISSNLSTVWNYTRHLQMSWLVLLQLLEITRNWWETRVRVIHLQSCKIINVSAMFVPLNLTTRTQTLLWKTGTSISCATQGRTVHIVQGATMLVLKWIWPNKLVVYKSNH